jgi:hypothetical protein
MPPDAVYVGRPTKWGNPDPVSSFSSAAAAVDQFRRYLYVFDNDGARELRAAVKAELRGKDLACWCPLDQPCHADVLLDLANR